MNRKIFTGNKYYAWGLRRVFFFFIHQKGCFVFDRQEMIDCPYFSVEQAINASAKRPSVTVAM